VEKQNKKLTFFRMIFLPFILISIFAMIYATNFFLAFVVDNSEAINIALKTGKSDSKEIREAYKNPSELVFKNKQQAKDTKNTKEKKPSGLLRLLLILFVYRKYKPFFRYIKDKNPEDEEKAVKTYNNFYSTIFILFALSHIIWFLIDFRKYLSLEFLGYALPYHLVQWMLECYLFYLYLEPTLFIYVSSYFQNTSLGKNKRKSISIYSKLLSMITFLVLIPLVIIGGLIISNCLILQVCKISASVLIFTVIIFLIGNLQILYKSIQEPLDTLTSKMLLVSNGNFDIQTSVLFDDEIGRLKQSFNTMVSQLREREELKNTFGKYVSIEVAKHLLQKDKIDLGGENIEATILFSDIRNFTSMSERMSPEEVVTMLNTYFSYVTEPIMAHNGVINKFIGDAVMAIFTPHLGSEDHVGDAIKSAIGMRESLHKLNQSGDIPVNIRFGVGLNTGPLIAGNIGTHKRFEYTVIGDTVNVASRMESLSKDLKADIVISENTFLRIPDDTKRNLKLAKAGPIKVKGKSELMPIYTLS